MLKPRLFLALAFLVLATAPTAPAQQLPQADPGLLAERRPAAFAGAVHRALENEQPAQAYLHARAWKRVAPGEIPPLTALASVYLAFDAPAAALNTLDAALALGPDAEETRRILALKIQTHAEMGDHPATWANARAYLRSATPDDPFVPVISQLQWNSFGPIVATAPHAAVQERVAASSEPLPFTAARIQATATTLTAELEDAYNRAYQSDNGDAIARATTRFMHYLLVAHYLSDPAQSGSLLTPLYDHPSVLDILRDLASGNNPSGLALSLLEWTPHRSNHNPAFSEDEDAGDGSDPAADAAQLRQEIRKFLNAAPSTWNDLQQSITTLLRDADAARTAPEIETALRDLITLQDTRLAALASQTIHYGDRLQPGQETDPTPPSAGDAALIQQLSGWTQAFQTAPIIVDLQRRLTPALPGDSSDAATVAVSLPHRLARLLLREADEAWAAPRLALDKIEAPRLEDFDLLIARGLMTPDLWSRRLALAEKLNDWTEVVWSGIELRAQDPQGTAAWLAPLIAENDASIARALGSLAHGNDEQKVRAPADLETGLRRDPGHLTGLQTLYQSYLDRGDDRTAAQIVESLWRLSPTAFAISDDTLALAARAGRWPLLLSLADHRLSRSDTDLTAHLHRQIAAIALGLGGLAADSTPALDGTVYTSHARVLHSMASELKTQDLGSFTHPVTGLQTTYTELGIDNDDPATRLWLALGRKFTDTAFRAGGVKWENLSAEVPPAMKAHLDFIRDDKPDTQAYLASFRGTADESLALFLHHFIAAQLSPIPANRDALAALSNRADLPLFFRAKAAAANNRAIYSPHIPLRASDPFYVAAGAKNWGAVWSTLASGQQLIALGAVELPKDTATLPILRLSRSPGNPLIPLSNTQDYSSRLWELEGVQINTRGRYANAWKIDDGAVAAVSRSSIDGRVFSGDGAFWLEQSDLSNTSGQLGQLFQSDVKTARTALVVTRHWEADRLRAEENIFQLGIATADAPPSRGIVSESLFVNHQSEPFNLRPSAALEIASTRFYTQKPLGLSPGQAAFKASRVTGAAQPALASAEGVRLTPLNLTGPADRTVSTAADLRHALGAARPGQRIDVAPGRILLDDGPIQVPHGVVLRGSGDWEKPTILSVTPGSPISPLIIVNHGDSWIENLTLDVEKATEMFNGRKIGIADRLSARKALVAQDASHPLLRGLKFPGWESSGSTRPAIVSKNARVAINGLAPRTLELAANGRIDHVGTPTGSDLFLSGSGDLYFSYTAQGKRTIAGKDARFHGSSASPALLAYIDGAGDPRTLVRRALTRQNFLDTLDRMKAQLPAQLDAAPDMDARIELFRSAATRLGPIIRTAQMTDPEIATAFSSRLNPAMTRRPDEFPFYMKTFHDHHRAFGSSGDLYTVHAQTFSPALRDRLKAHLHALIGSRERTGGRLSSADRSNLIALMRNHPIGSPNHARALAAFNRGESAATFQQELRAEAEARRRAAEHAAALKRQQQLEWERQRLAARIPPAPEKKSWWEDYKAAYPSGRYNSRGSTGGSANQQMRNYRHELNKRIYNTGRDYGERRIY